jgi:putative MATE family efflux protein
LYEEQQCQVTLPTFLGKLIQKAFMLISSGGSQSSGCKDEGGTHSVSASRNFKAADMRALVMPLFVELALGMFVGMVGTTLASHISDAAGGGFALANHLFGLLFMVFRLVGAGVSVVITQNLGAGQRDEADRVSRAALASGTWMGGLAALLAAVAAVPLLQLLNAPSEVHALAAPFLQTLALALLLDAWNACMAGVMRAHLLNRDTLLVTVVMHLMHLSLVWPLMHGWGSWSGWGLPGFAVAVIISRIVGMALHLWLWRLRLGLRPSWVDWWRVRRAQIFPVMHIGLPGAAENLSWELAFMGSVAAVGLLGTQALATQTYVLQFNMWILISGVAIGITVEMVVGHLIGARQMRQAHDLVRKAQKIGFFVTLLVACMLALAGPWLLRLFTQDPHILDEGSRLLWLSILLETGRTFNLIVIAALRATGDARYPFYAGVGSMAVVLAGGSWLFGVHWGWGLYGVWIAYAADEWIRGLLMWRRWLTQGWVPHARKAHARMRAQTPSGH